MINKIDWAEKIMEYKLTKTGYDSFGILTTLTDRNGVDIRLGNKVIDINEAEGIVIFNPLWNDWALDYDYGGVNIGYLHITPEIAKTLEVIYLNHGRESVDNIFKLGY